MPTAEIKSQVSDTTLRNLLCSALESGSKYWYMHTRSEFADGLSYDDFREGGKCALAEYWHPLELIPFVEGCALILTTDAAGDEGDTKEYRLDKAALMRGVQIMAEKYPQHFANVTTENDDAETGDVYLQCCLFGEIVYG
jgi:hypothetical protein